MSNRDAQTDMQNPQTQENTLTGRRRMLEIIGTTAIALPVLGLSACGGDTSSEAAKTNDVVPKATAAPAKEAAKAMETMETAAADMAESAEQAAKETMQETKEAANEMVAEAKQEVAAAADTIASDGMARLEESNPQAMALGYRHDATTVDSSVQTRYQAGQQCSNCVLFQGGDAEWGACPLFAGTAVKNTGWCSAYAARG